MGILRCVSKVQDKGIPETMVCRIVMLMCMAVEASSFAVTAVRVHLEASEISLIGMLQYTPYRRGQSSALSCQFAILKVKLHSGNLRTCHAFDVTTSPDSAAASWQQSPASHTPTHIVEQIGGSGKMEHRLKP